MSTQRFSVGKQFLWQNTIYEVRRLLPGNFLKIENILTAQSRVVPFSELVQALFDGILRFVEPGRPIPTNTCIDLSDAPANQREIAEFRLQVIKPLLKLSKTQRTTAIVTQRVSQIQELQQANKLPSFSISAGSIYRWMREYTAGGNDLRALLPDFHKRGGKGKTRIEGEVDTIIREVIEGRYYIREKVKVNDILHEVAVRIEHENKLRDDKLAIPSQTTVWRRIEALDERGKLIAKKGRRAAELAMTQYGQMEYPLMPLERVEIDHTRADIIIVDDQDNLPIGRLTLTYCIDTATRYPLGYYLSFEPPSYFTVMECLYHSILPKGNIQEKYGTQQGWLACGVPNTLVVDNGKEFIGQDLQDSCHALGTILERMPVKTPWFKAAVERMFGTLNTGLLHTLPGTTFSNLSQRNDYESLKYASLTLGELDQLVHIFLLDIYAQSFHKGLGGIPAERWIEATQNGFFPRVPVNPNELRVLLGRVAYRTVQPTGIEFRSLRYNCSELSLLRTRLRKQPDKQVKVKYHPGDLSRLHVFDPFVRRYIEVPALAQEYTQGLSLWKHEIIRGFVLDNQDKVDMAALGRAKQKIQEIVAESKQRKKLSTRSKIARWENAGQSLGNIELPEEPDTTIPDFDIDLDNEALTNEGWGVSYDMPIAAAGG